MKHLLLLLLALLTGCASFTTPPKSTPADVADTKTAQVADLESKTVALVKMPEDEWRAYCSGVWVSQHEIVTAFHCVHDEDTDTVASDVFYAAYDDVGPKKIEQGHFALVAKTDPAHDLALLSVPMPMSHGIAAVDRDPYKGESVANMGQSLSLLTWSYSTGVVASVRRLDLSEDGLDPALVWVQSTAPTSPGNSGGGLFDESGNLLGICSRGFTYGQNLNLFIHVAHVRALLKG